MASNKDGLSKPVPERQTVMEFAALGDDLEVTVTTRALDVQSSS